MHHEMLQNLGTGVLCFYLGFAVASLIRLAAESYKRVRNHNRQKGRRS